VNGLDTKRLTTKNITVTNAAQGIKVSVATSTLAVTVRAKADLLKEIQSDNLRVVVDLADYANTIGTVSVPAKVYIDGFEKAGAVGTYSVSVTISR
jgi:hypothetical protein